MAIAYFSLPTGNVQVMNDVCAFPAVENALVSPNGLLAIGGSLNASRLLEAYSKGIFPWFSENEPVLWWSPNPRLVLMPDELKISHSLAKRLKKMDYEFTVNTSFTEVIHSCALARRPGQNGTWITNQVIDGYTELFKLGYAHSFEIWIDNELAGGLYGVALGKVFFGESMFHRVTDASKIAFVHMVQHIRNKGFKMIDCQMKTSHLISLGAREISRKEFSRSLTKLVECNYDDAK